MSNVIGRHHRYPASQGKRFSGDTTLVTVECPTCFVTYAIPEGFYNSARKFNRAEYPGDFRTVCCPFGHTWHYTGVSEEERLRRQRDAARDDAARVAAQRDQAKASEKAQRGAATRARNERDRLGDRAKAGVCPCCNRTFKQLGRHMENQHPEFDPRAED